jgi:hypothetical protein
VSASGVALLIALWMVLPACNRELKSSGDSCTRSSECGEALVCIDNACGDDLRALGDRGGTVPMLMTMPAQEMGLEAGVDAAMTGDQLADAAPAPDAHMQMPDAGP